MSELSEAGGSRNGGDFKRAALGDITNVYGKRMLPLDSDQMVAGNKIGKYQVGAATLGKGIVEAVGTFTRRKDKGDCIPESLVDDKGKNLSAFVPKQLQCSLTSDFQRGAFQYNPFSGFQPMHVAQNPLTHGAMEADRVGPGCISFTSVPGEFDRSSQFSAELDEDCLDDDQETESEDSTTYHFQTKRDHENSADSGHTCLDFTAAEEMKVGSAEGPNNNIPFGKPLSVECMKPSVPFDPKTASMVKFTNAPSNCGEIRTGSEESCNCSFCLKAAYMWTDLHYQDTRGRLSALKRSKRIARSVEGRICGNDNTAKTTRDNSTRFSGLEFELVQHWRSLFRYTEDVLLRETAQLHATLLRLKEIRENCKRNLEMISTVPSNK